MVESNTRRKSNLPWGAALVFAVGCAGPGATSPADPIEAARTQSVDTERLAVFEPNPVKRNVKVNYDPYDEVLDGIVLQAGPSLRRPAGPPRPFTGSRIVYGHTSPLRLEGNKVFFSRMKPDRKEAISQLVADLIKFGNKVSIPSLPKDEQLVYWFNLHNLLVVKTIADHYPAMYPRKIAVGTDDVPLHDAKLATINGVPLSLRDIRVGIVYRNWDDPRVIYGFFHGDLGSPSIRHRAWRAESLSIDLGVNAYEFVNSLRGIRRTREVMLVSPLYEEARAALFTDWPDDLRAHLRDFSERDVDIILDETDKVEYSKYERRTADLVGGRPHTPSAPIRGANFGPARQVKNGNTDYQRPNHVPFPKASPSFVFMLGEFAEKFQELKRLKRRTGKGFVEIIDLPVDPADDDS